MDLHRKERRQDLLSKLGVWGVMGEGRRENRWKEGEQRKT